MTEASRPCLPQADEPFPSGLAGRLLTSAALVAAMVIWLALMGRPLTCACGTVEFWQGGLNPAENSQHFSDWYSLLHGVFGMGLFVLTDRMRPGWRIGGKFLAVLLGHTIWEIVENTPVVIALFSGAAGAPAYAGDSILNALGDTAYAMIGALAASRLPLAAILILAVLLEAAASIAMDDGLVLGTLRLLGVPA